MSINAPLKDAKGLGSAKEGSHHFWVQRVSAIALIPLVFWFACSILEIIGAPIFSAKDWVGQSHNALLLMLFVSTAIYHAYLGMQTVFEDYVSCKCAKVAIMVVMQLGFILLAAATIFSILIIYFKG